jgi:hypothetical protein
MGFLEGLLINKGDQVTIERAVPVTSYATIERFTRSQDANVRENLKWGYILASSSLISGEIFTANGNAHLTVSASPHVSGEYEYTAYRCNADVTLQREVEDVNANGDLTKTWTAVGQSKGWIQVVTAKLRLTDPGLVDGAKYTLQVPKSLGAQVLDRVVYAEHNYRVESVDDVAMDGVVKLQLSEDYR